MPLTADRLTSERVGKDLDIPVAASTKIYAGSMVMVNSNGYAVPAADIASCVFMGVALAQVDNSAGADGALTVTVRTQGQWLFVGTTLTQASVGAAMYAIDDQTFAASSSHSMRVGICCKYVSATSGWIDIRK